MKLEKQIRYILCGSLVFLLAACSGGNSIQDGYSSALPVQEDMEDLAEDSYLMYQKNGVMVNSTAVMLFHEAQRDRISFNMTVMNSSDQEVSAMPVIEDLILEGEGTIAEVKPIVPEKDTVGPGEQNGVSYDLFLTGAAEAEKLITLSGSITVNDASGTPLSEPQHFIVVLNEDLYTPPPVNPESALKVETDFAVYEIPEQVNGPDGQLTQLFYMVQEDTVRHSISPDFMSDYFSVYVRDLADYEIYFDGQEIPSDITLEALNDTIVKWRCNPEKAGEYLTSDYKETEHEKLTIGGKDALRIVSEYRMPDTDQIIYSDITFVASEEGKVLSIVNSGYSDKYEMFKDAVQKVRETMTFPKRDE